MIIKDLGCPILKNACNGTHIFTCPFELDDEKEYYLNRVNLYSSGVFRGKVAIESKGFYKEFVIDKHKWRKYGNDFRFIIVPDGMKDKICRANFTDVIVKIKMETGEGVNVLCEWRIVSF